MPVRHVATVLRSRRVWRAIMGPDQPSRSGACFSTSPVNIARCEREEMTGGHYRCRARAWGSTPGSASALASVDPPLPVSLCPHDARDRAGPVLTGEIFEIPTGRKTRIEGVARVKYCETSLSQVYKDIAAPVSTPGVEMQYCQGPVEMSDTMSVLFTVVPTPNPQFSLLIQSHGHCSIGVPAAAPPRASRQSWLELLTKCSALEEVPPVSVATPSLHC